MLNLPMSQRDLARVLPLAWQDYLDYQPTLVKYKARYTPQLATAALLPDVQARNADPELTRIKLMTQGRELLHVGQWLDGYIEQAYPGEASYQAMRDAVSYKSYAAAASSAMKALLNSAKQLVKLHDEGLQTKGDMPDICAARVVAEATDVETMLRPKAREEQADAAGTLARLTALLACLKEWMVVSRDAVVLGSGGGWARQELPVTLEAGVKKQMDGVVGKTGVARSNRIWWAYRCRRSASCLRRNHCYSLRYAKPKPQSTLQKINLTKTQPHGKTNLIKKQLHKKTIS